MLYYLSLIALYDQDRPLALKEHKSANDAFLITLLREARAVTMNFATASIGTETSGSILRPAIHNPKIHNGKDGF